MNNLFKSCFTNVRKDENSKHIKKKANSKAMSSYELKNIYHEKQVKELCALHALNNLFQNGNAFTKQMLDDICHNLSPDNFVNPHKSILGLGNYDVNVIMAALQMKGYEVIWFDNRKDPCCINLCKIHGFILNVPSEYKIGFLQLPIHRKHWIAIREVNNKFFNLDSKLDHPIVIGEEAEVIDYLREQMQSKDKATFIVVSQDVERSKAWLLDSKKDLKLCKPNVANNVS